MDGVPVRTSSTVAATLGRDLVEYCESLGIDAEPLAEMLAIETALFSDFEARIDFDAFCRLLEILSALAKRDDFGIRYADFFKPGGTGALGQGLMAAPTIEALFRFLDAYLSIFVDHRSFETTFERDRLTIEWSYSPLISRHEQFVSFSVRNLVKLLGNVTGGRQRYRAFCFQHQAPQNIRSYQKAFPGRLHFGQDANRVIFSTDLFEMANPFSDPVAFEFMRQNCERISNQIRTQKRLDVMLREDIMDEFQFGGLSIEEAARRNGMSARTLQRRLAELSLTYEVLVDDARFSLVQALLRDRNKSMATISELVGYSDQSAFSRAVVKRFNITPTQLRSDLLSGDPIQA